MSYLNTGATPVGSLIGEARYSTYAWIHDIKPWDPGSLLVGLDRFADLFAYWGAIVEGGVSR